MTRAGTAGERYTSSAGLGLPTVVGLLGIFPCEASSYVASECNAKVAPYR